MRRKAILQGWSGGPFASRMMPPDDNLSAHLTALMKREPQGHTDEARGDPLDGSPHLFTRGTCARAACQAMANGCGTRVCDLTRRPAQRLTRQPGTVPLELANLCALNASPVGTHPRRSP